MDFRGVYSCPVCKLETDRLADHLKRKHSELPQEEVDRNLDEAKKRRPRLLQRGLSLVQSVVEIANEEDKEEAESYFESYIYSSPSDLAATNPFAAEDLPGRISQKDRSKRSKLEEEHGLRASYSTSIDCLQQLHSWLISIAGKQLCTKTADSYVQHTAKILWYLDQNKPDLNNFLNTNKVGEYIDKLKGLCGAGPAGLKAKLDAAKHVLDYLDSFDREDIVKSSVRISKAMGRYKAMYRRFSKETTHQRSLRVEQEHSLAASPDLIEEIVSDRAAYARTQLILTVGKANPDSVRREDLLFVCRFVLSLLTLDNGQRPGPACNMNLIDFEDAKLKASQGEDARIVITVREHKTGSIAPAYLIVRPQLLEILQGWADVLRPIVVGRTDSTSERFLLNANGRSIISSRAAGHMRAFGKAIGKHVPCATLSRKLTSTAVVDSLPQEDARNVSRFMSHTPGSAAKYYQHIGRKHVAKKHYDLMVEARKKKGQDKS